MNQNIDDASLRVLALEVGELLLATKQYIATAESCTGGWVAKCLTDIPGSSAWFNEGVVSYSNAAKQRLLSVKMETLADFGAVSEPVAREMAQGVLTGSEADVALAISGIAGPGGATPEKPVGTVCFAWVTKNGLSESETRLFSGGREAVRRQSVVLALQGVVKILQNVLENE